MGGSVIFVLLVFVLIFVNFYVCFYQSLSPFFVILSSVEYLCRVICFCVDCFTRLICLQLCSMIWCLVRRFVFFLFLLEFPFLCHVVRVRLYGYARVRIMMDLQYHELVAAKETYKKNGQA